MFRDYTNYDVCEDGRIWSKKKKKFLKPHTVRGGYQIVGLYDNNGKQHWQCVHKIVYFAVNGLWEYPEGMQINHKDEDKTNNHISNLELVTPKENLNFGTRNERAAAAISKALKGKFINRQDQSKRVGAYDKNGELVIAFASINEAHRNGYSSGHVWACCNGKRKTHKGYEWKYLEE